MQIRIVDVERMNCKGRGKKKKKQVLMSLLPFIILCWTEIYTEKQTKKTTFDQKMSWFAQSTSHGWKLNVESFLERVEK